MAVTSRVFARSSSSVPIWPGPQVLGRRELHGRRRTALEQRHALRLARRVPHHLVDLAAAPPPVASRPPEQVARCRRTAARGARPRPTPVAGRQREGAGGRPALLEHGDRLRDRPLRQAHHDRDAPGRAAGRVRRTAPPSRRRSTSRTARSSPGSPRSTRPVGCRLAPFTAAVRHVDRHVPLVADRVPVELDVVGEPVQCALDPVPDLVGVPAGDRPVRVADLDRGDAPARMLDRVVGGGVARRCHRQDRQWVVAVVRVVVPERVGMSRKIPWRSFDAEVVVDRLGDRERPVVLDHDRDVVAVDPFGGLGMRGRRRQHDPSQHAERDRRDPPHRVSTKKNEMAMIR